MTTGGLRTYEFNFDDPIVKAYWLANAGSISGAEGPTFDSTNISLLGFGGYNDGVKLELIGPDGVYASMTASQSQTSFMDYVGSTSGTPGYDVRTPLYTIPASRFTVDPPTLQSNSILNDVKKTLGLAPDYNVFDQEVITHINSVLMTLTQLGVGPVNGFMIQDETATWTDFIDDIRYNGIKSYIYMKVRLIFDPPQLGYVIDAFKAQIQELEWRINVMREEIVHPTPPPVVIPDDSFGF